MFSYRKALDAFIVLAVLLFASVAMAQTQVQFRISSDFYWADDTTRGEQKAPEFDAKTDARRRVGMMVHSSMGGSVSYLTTFPQVLLVNGRKMNLHDRAGDHEPIMTLMLSVGSYKINGFVIQALDGAWHWVKPFTIRVRGNSRAMVHTVRVTKQIAQVTWSPRHCLAHRGSSACYDPNLYSRRYNFDFSGKKVVAIPEGQYDIVRRPNTPAFDDYCTYDQSCSDKDVAAHQTMFALSCSGAGNNKTYRRYSCEKLDKPDALGMTVTFTELVIDADLAESVTLYQTGHEPRTVHAGQTLKVNTGDTYSFVAPAPAKAEGEGKQAEAKGDTGG